MIIRNLDPNKAHGDGTILIQMIKIYDTSICRPLKWMEKIECGSNSQEMWQVNIKKLSTNIVTPYYW